MSTRFEPQTSNILAVYANTFTTPMSKYEFDFCLFLGWQKATCFGM